MTHSTIHADVADILLALEAEMRRLDLWLSERPDDAAFQSSLPFCVDTMEFSVWLQFVFVERIRLLVESGQAMPQTSGIAPMAQEFFIARGYESGAVVTIIERFDRLIAQASI